MFKLFLFEKDQAENFFTLPVIYQLFQRVKQTLE